MTKVLVVSADRIAADALSDILAEGRHSTAVVGNVAEAVEQLRAQHFNAVVTDSFGKAAPGELDWKAMRPLLDAAQGTAVILCSDWLTETATSEAEERFADIIWKPLDPDDLVERVQAALAED